ncbi:MAG: PDZ domain-containing protein [Opitutaceae bacterium]|nr:PDZ domain-containing protein [Opitutaceae bacterium]
MKKKFIVPVLIYALPALLALAGPVMAAGPDPKPATVERRIEVRSTGATPGQPLMPDRPVEPVTFLGLEVAPVDEALAAQLKLPPDHGLIVRFVVPDSPAAAAGVQKHDVLTRLDDQVLIAPRQLSALVRARKEGDAIKLTYVRAGAEARATATLVKRVPPPAPLADRLQWFGASGETHAIPAQRRFIFRSDAGTPGGAVLEEDRIIGAPLPGDGTPHVMVFRPQTRVVYREGDVTLEVSASDQGRTLEARGADGVVLYSGPINTPEERQAVPADLQKHLEKLDALEPSQFQMAVPAPRTAPAPMPAPAHTTSWQAAPVADGEAVIQTTVELSDDVDAPAPGHDAI